MAKQFLALILTAAIAGVSCNPTLVARQRGYIKLCSDLALQGECEDLGITIGACENLPSRLVDELSSFDTYGYRCNFYTDINCTGRLDGFTGRQDDLRNTEWNDEKSSVTCYWDA
ncbi:hypothetical protein ACN47E_003552 [Coniothyrium glycines]